MKYVGIHEVIACNEEMRKMQLPYKLHLRDACGRQSFWIEPLEEKVDITIEAEMFSFIQEYFLKIGFTLLHKEENKYDFWI